MQRYCDHRRQEWHVQWIQNGEHCVRAFRGAYGMQKTREAAEKYLVELAMAGKVDKLQTERQRRAVTAEGMARTKAMKAATLLRTKEELVARWDAYWEKAKYHWEDNHIKTQLKKYGKILDPTYRPPDIDIKKLRAMK